MNTAPTNTAPTITALTTDVLPHPIDCACDDCRAAFDAAMWGWLEPRHVAVVAREARSGDVPDA